MSTHPRDLTWTQSGEPLLVEATGLADYTHFTDEELELERNRQQAQLDELRLHPRLSPAVDHLRTGIEREVEGMTRELRHRARSRHPSSRGMSSRLRPLRSLSWPPHTDHTD